jgi:altronate hydrolase
MNRDPAPMRIPQSGEGTFLRTFFDWMVDRMRAGASFDELAVELLREIIAVAEGKRAEAELGGYREIAIFKDGVTL